MTPHVANPALQLESSSGEAGHKVGPAFGQRSGHGLSELPNRKVETSVWGGGLLPGWFRSSPPKGYASLATAILLKALISVKQPSDILETAIGQLING